MAFRFLESAYKHPIAESDVIEVKRELSQFVSQCEHWRCPARQRLSYAGEDIEFWLHSWLRGEFPPLRCQGVLPSESESGAQCMEVASNNSSYCTLLHACLSKNCVRERAPGGFIFCKYHKCDYTSIDNQFKCTSERFHGSSFCSQHTCINCLHQSETEYTKLEPVASDYGCCLKHQCQYFFGEKDQCLKAMLSPFLFCKDHCCHNCLKRGYPLDRPIAFVGDEQYCVEHKCSVKGCFKESIMENFVCADHVCLLCAYQGPQSQWNCIDLSVPKSRFCYNHRCSYFEDCMRPVADGSVFCASHSCRLCLDSNITPPLGIIVDNFPRNVCSSHMLCSHVFSRGTLCQSLAVAETPYCDYHNKLKDDFEIIRPTKVKERGLKKAVVIGDRCNGITKKTHQQCKTAQSLRMFGGKAYCKDHQAQSGVKVEDSNVDDNGDNDDDDDGIFSEEEMALEKESYILQQFVIDSHNNSDQKLFDELMQIRERVHLASQFKSLNTPVFRCSSTDCRAYLYQPDSEPMVYCARHRPNRIYEVDHMEVDDDNGVDDGHIAEEIMDLEDSAGPTNADDTHLIDEPIKNASIVEDPIATGLVEIADPIVDVLEDVADDVAGDIHPDELDMVYEDEDELNEEQRRLKDIIDKDDNDDSDDESIQSAFDGQEGKVNTSFLESDAQDYDERFAKQLVQSWDWNMPTEQRWESVAKFLHCMSVIINNLRLKAADHIVDARERRAEASAKSFRKAKIVGSTVVGASRRLEAIRIAEPFAVVVEECCEVMEPTLLAVLAVKSLRKLEMIGDHRQLPAFVQTYWYNLELTHRSIKVSLFERLVEGSNNSKNQCPTKRKADDEDAIPLRCSILDEQRRMRTAIADLTRPEYADLVAIKDHPHTSRQKVGDVFLKTSRDNKKMEELKANRSLWETNGREVPGVLPSVFFWDLTDNREGKPVAGLSACNPTEAEAVGCLTRHMITCGIPPSSITIITPYKGQKTMLTKILRSMNVLPKYNPSVVQDFSTCVNISTVDRYQGDENDIVILSLVKTRPGNRFVGLSNRFVVAASRARLGCYIVGTAEAVVKDWQGHDGPPHWRRFFEDLTNVIPGAPATSVANDFIFSEARVSSSIPICCPRHRTQTARNVAKISEFPSHENWNNFCCHPCAYQLPTCTHLCAKLCHSPSYTAHTERCEVTIDSPCPIHYATKLVCNEVLGTAPTLQKALDRFECAIEVSHHRPECNHVVAITCHLNSLIDSGQRSLPNCEEIVGDFVHPQCNHLFSKPACYRRRSYEKTPPMCKEKVVHTRSCGCKVLMRCHQRIAEMEMTQPPSCLVDVTIARPRCSHKLSLRCHEAKTLQQQWQQLNTIDTVEPTKFGNILLKSGCTYGPDESLLLAKIPRCSVMVDYMNKCGHVMQNIPCHKAFNFANGSIAVEPCQSLVRMSSPLCSHIIEIPCWLEAQVKAWEPWGAGVEPEFDENFAFVSEQLLRSVSCIDLGIIDIMKKACIKSMRVRRECNHLHITSVSCSRLFDFIVTKNPLDVCTEIVSRNLPCGHLTNVPCCKRFDRPPLCREKIEDVYTHSCRIHSVQPRVCHKYHQLLSMNPPPVCADPVTSNRYRCDHLITVACGISEKVVAESPGARLLDQVDPYTVEEDLNYCRGEVDIPICSEVVKFKRSCGHIITDIQCHTAFAFADKTIQIPHCDQIEVCVSPLCGHSIELACSTKPRLMEWVAWPNLGPVYEEILDTTASDCDQVIRVLREESIEEYAANLPPPLVKNQLECNSPILFVRKCGHSLKVRCVDILFGTDGIGRCSDVVVYRCELCMSDRKTSCYDYVTQKVSGVFRPCTNEVEKCCSLCNVNIVKTSCGNSNPLCNKIVNFNLQCSHNVSWRCGKEEDPRNRQFQCRICVHGKWLETLDQHSKSKGRLLELGSQLNFIPRVRDAIGGYEVLRMVDINVSINNFYNARMNIIQDFATVLGKGSKIDLMLPPEMFASQIDVDSYHIVYKGKKGMLEESQYKQFLTIPGDGVFGRGVYINRLTSPAQLEELEETDGVVKVVFGVAFSLRLLQDSPPFGIDTNAEKKIDTKQMEKINKKMQNFKSCGYDGVLLPQKPNTTTQGVAYWTPSIVLPVCYAELKIHVKCSLCLDYFASKDGFFCSNRHFICWESCFEGYVKSANSPNPIQRSVDTDGNLTCPECKESYDLQRVGMNGPANSFQSLLKLKTDCIANQRTKEALDAEVARAASEFERIMKLDLEDRIAALVHRDIVDEILTLKCPRCKAAFDEFEGCCAVSCHCTSSFCAFCLKDCGEDAHGHVAQCIENPTRGDVFCSQDVLKGQRKNRWRRLILERLRRESQNTQKKVKELLIVEISDLGINL